MRYFFACLFVGALAGSSFADAPPRRSPPTTAEVFAAIEGDRYGDVQDMLDHGADVNGRYAEYWGKGFYGDLNYQQTTPLIIAAAHNNEGIVKLLLQRGADPDLANVQGKKAADVTLLPLAELIKLNRPAPAASQAPAAAPGISREDMQRMIDEAARKAAESAAARPAPAPASAPAEPSRPASKTWASDVDAPRYREEPRPEDVALVIGVEKYNDLPEAQFAERDAKAVQAHLFALGYAPRNVVLLTGAAASRAGFVKNIEKRLPEMVRPDSTVFFYYSGHGAPDAATGKAYLVPADGDPQFLEETAYPMSRVYEKLGALKAKRVVVALDACFSGAGGRSVLARGTRPLVSKIDAGAAPPKVVALSAAGSSQIAGTIEEQGHGAFTYFLLKGLAGGKRSAKSLYDFLSPEVQDAARLQNRDQSPTLTGDDASLR